MGYASISAGAEHGRFVQFGCTDSVMDHVADINLRKARRYTKGNLLTAAFVIRALRSHFFSCVWSVDSFTLAPRHYSTIPVVG